MLRVARVLACAVAFLASVAAPPALAKEPKPGKDPTVVAGDLGRRLDAAVAKAGGTSFWGAVLVARGGQVLLAKGYGFADYDARPNRPDTLFEIASASKQVTATAILRLEQQKKLSLDDPVTRFFPKAPKDKEAVTVRHLLNHTAGLAETLAVPYSWTGSRDVYAREMLDPPLSSAPGERFSYSNVGYALLAAIVEEVTGGAFEAYCEKELFAKAGLSSTGFVADPDLVKSERVSVRRAEDSRPGDTAAAWFWGWGYRGMGGVVTTVLDLHAWDRALRTDRVLGEEAKKRLHTPALAGYACGWKIEATERGTTKVHHAGGVRGYACQVARWLEDDAFVAVLSNGKTNVLEVERALASLLFAPPRVEVEVDSGSRRPDGNGAVRSDSATFSAKAERGSVVIRMAVGKDDLATIRLPDGYAKKVAADLESVLTGRDDLDAKPSLDAGIYLGAYGGARKVRLEEETSVQVLPRYPGSTGTEEVVVFVVVDGRKRNWPVMVKLNGSAAKALLATVRGAL